MGDSIFIGLGDPAGEKLPQALVLRRANRHGLIAGATGTGKTVTLQTLAEGFSREGVPVFLSDVKGDIAGMAKAGSDAAAWTGKRAAEIGMADYDYAANPVVFWDLFGEQGHPVRTTISEMGPLLLARLMGLNDTQEGVLSIAFRYADDLGLLLLDMKDLQAMLVFCADNAAELSTRYGNITKASVGSIQRQLLQLQTQGGDNFFAEPALDINDFIRVDAQGRGQVNILAADRLMQSPRLYATFLLVAAVGAVLGAPRGRRPGQAQAGVLLRRGAPAVRRGARCVDGQGGAGRPPRPLKGRRRLFHQPEPHRHSRKGGGAARQPRPARAARLHAARPARHQGGERDVPQQSQAGCGDAPSPS